MYLKKICPTILIALIALMQAPAQVADAAKLPDTPAGRQVAAFIRSFNSGDDGVRREFHTKNVAGSGGARAEEYVAMDRRLHGEMGAIELSRVLESNPHSIAVLFSTKNGRRLKLRLEVESQPPHGITSLGLEPAEAPADNKPAGAEAKAKMTETEMVASVEAYLDELVKADKFSGVVLIARDGRPVFKKAYGLANKGSNLPNLIDTKFNLGSMNKMFTAVAIAQLAERGKLAFTDTVGKHLPGYPNKEVADKVTIHHLLTHTSGMGSYWNDKFDANKESIRSVADYLSLFVNDGLAFEPGARFEYSNSGFIVLGAIIEKVSGQSYYDYVREHIYKPAGMTGTDAYEVKQKAPNLATGYTKMGGSGPRKENLSTLPNKGGPAGGGYSTAEDLLKFTIALKEHKLLGPKYSEIVTTGKVEAGMGKYAYGFGDRRVNGKRVFGHNGGAPGIASDLSVYPEAGYTSVVLTNYDPPQMMAVVKRIQDMITRL